MGEEYDARAQAKEQYQVVKHTIESASRDFEQVLEGRIPLRKFIRMSLSAISEVPQLLQADGVSLKKALLECARLGLEPGGTAQEAHIIPYRRGGTLVAQLQLGYRGWIKVVTRNGNISRVAARPVFQGDEFHYRYGLHEELMHVPLTEPEPDVLTHVYAVAWHKDSNTPPDFIVMTRGEVDQLRKRSGSRSDAWDTDYIAMALKSVIRKLCKTLPISDMPRESGEEQVSMHDVEIVESRPRPQLADAFQRKQKPTFEDLGEEVK